MRYYISRTSKRYTDQPCEGAITVEYDTWDQRTFKTVEEYDEKFAQQFEPWLARGSDHGVNNIGIYRRLPDKTRRWIIEGQSIESIVTAHGRVIVKAVDELERRDDPSIEYDIEIYDGWRE